MKRTESGLIVATSFNFLRRYGRAKGTERVVVLPTGERVRVWQDDSRTVRQIEHDETLDAIVNPKPISMAFRSRRSTGRGARRVIPNPIRTGLRMKGTR
jgi:hypothetical protein